MTTPEENAPKTDDTDQVLPGPDAGAGPQEQEEQTEMGAQLKKAMSEADMDREDLTGER